MLTKRDNFLETIHGGNPDRFVNQYEFFTMLFGDPIMRQYPMARPGGGPVKNGWGVTINWPEGLPGQFPVHDYEHRVIKDIEHWKDTVKHPNLDIPESAWEDYEAAAKAVDRREQFCACAIFPGVFEQVHYLMSIDEALLAFYTNPDEMHELIDYITDYELKLAELLVKHGHPDAVFHHDDWGSHNSSFMSPEMFNEFIVPAYMKIYGYYKEHGCEIVIHHSDSYAANLVPAMIEMGIDVFQGCVTTNNVPELVKKYGGQISFMGDINNGVVDVRDWTPELVEREVRRACETNGKHYFIPCLTAGGPGSTYPGVYECATEMINKMSKEMF